MLTDERPHTSHQVGRALSSPSPPNPRGCGRGLGDVLGSHSPHPHPGRPSRPSTVSADPRLPRGGHHDAHMAASPLRVPTPSARALLTPATSTGVLTFLVHLQLLVVLYLLSNCPFIVAFADQKLHFVLVPRHAT